MKGICVFAPESLLVEQMRRVVARQAHDSVAKRHVHVPANNYQFGGNVLFVRRTDMKKVTACPFLGGGMPGLLSVEAKSSKEHLMQIESKCAHFQQTIASHELSFTFERWGRSEVPG